MHHHVRNAHAPISAATQEKAANTKAAIEEKYAQMRKVRRRKAEESAGPSISNCSPRRATSSTQQGMGMEWAGGHRSKGLLALACNCASHNPGASDPGPQTTRRFAARGSARLVCLAGLVLTLFYSAPRRHKCTHLCPAPAKLHTRTRRRTRRGGQRWRPR